MPNPGAAPWEEELPPSVDDEVSWREADWNWDPVAMIATARRTATAAGALPCSAQPAVGPCHSSGSLGAGLCMMAETVLPAAGAPNNSSSATHTVEVAVAGGGGGGGASSSPPGRARGGAKQRKGGAAAAGGACVCQADGCTADLTTHTYYHQRNKICMLHIKADSFVRNGEQLRFCQRCGHAHPLDEFDPGKHSCRKQLEKHNARRRKRQEAAAAARAGTPDPDFALSGGAAGTRKAAAPPSRATGRQQAGPKRSRLGQSPSARQNTGAPACQASASLDVAPSADALEAFEAALGAGSAGSYPSSGLQDESASPGHTASLSASPLSRAQQQQAQRRGGAAAPVAALPGAVPLAQQLQRLGSAVPASSDPGGAGSFGADTSASAVVTTTQRSGLPRYSSVPQSLPEADGCNLREQRPPSPELPLLEFDLDLKPDPFEDLFGGSRPAPMRGTDGALADDLAAWLSSHLSGDDPYQQRGGTNNRSAQASWQPPGGLPAPGGRPWERAGGQQPPHPHPYGASQLPSIQVASGIVQQTLLPPSGLVPGMSGEQHMQPSPFAAHGQLFDAAANPAHWPQPLAHTGGLPPAAQPPAAPAAAPSPTLTTVSVKLFGCTPAELPPGLREHLKGWFDGAVGGLDGYLRPGCVHLTVQAVLDSFAARQLARPAAVAVEDVPGPLSPAHQQQVAPPAPLAAAAGGTNDQQAEQPPQPSSCCAAKPAAGQPQAAHGVPAPQPTDTSAQPPAALPPHGTAGQAAAPPAPACCGRKRAAEAPPEPAEVGTDAAVRRIVARMLQSGEALWRSKTMLVQAGGHVALVHAGRLRRTWDTAAPTARAVPAILEASPPVLLAGQPGALRVRGINMLQNDCLLLLRLQGQYVQPLAASCEDCPCAAVVDPGQAAGPAAQATATAAAATFERRCCGCCVNKLQLAGLLPRAPAAVGAVPAATAATAAAEPSCCQSRPATGSAAVHAASSPKPSCCGGAAAAVAKLAAGKASVQSVRLLLPKTRQPHCGGAGAQEQALLPGLLHLDVQRRAYVAPQGARVLVVSSPAVHSELLQLAQKQGGLPQPLLDQLGVVHEWIGRPEKMQYQLVEATAARLLYWAAGAGLPATAELLLPVLQAQGGASEAAAAAVLHRALSPASGDTAAALASLDGLAQLHLSMQATGAAAMQRAAELACHDGLSLLHRAVQSRCGATLAAVLGWGEESGMPWRCDLAGLLGITPLHLAALLPDAATARHTLLTLMSRCAPGAAAWRACCTNDGHSPADFYAAASAARGGDALQAASALEADVAALLQLQQARLPRPRAVAPPPKFAVPAPSPSAVRAKQQQHQQQQEVQPHAGPAPRSVAAAGAAAGAEALVCGDPDMQPGTPRKNPGCMCAPGCPCALLDSCACCSSDSEEEESGSPRLGTCGAGSGKCCCCSADESSHQPGCAGCAAADGAGGACCGGSAAPSLAAAPSACCGGRR